MTVERVPVAFGGAFPFTGRVHHDPAVPFRGRVAILCGPLGHESTRAYRSLRHLADRLARAGIPALRVDYHGTGNSPGNDLDPQRLTAWRANISAACNWGRSPFAAFGDGALLPGLGTEPKSPERAPSPNGPKGLRPQIVVVGVRLGATLAARVAESGEIDHLVLWNPVVSGRMYARELQAIAAAAAKVQCDVPGALEAGGFLWSGETLEGIKAIDLKAATPKARRVLILQRDDMAIDDALANTWRERGVAAESEPAPGWAGMMAEHQFTVVPDAALDRIVTWAGEGAAPAGAEFKAPRRAEEFAPRERPVYFDGLAGVIHEPEAESGKPAIVMFNAGAVHHIGPNRIYVEMARRLAREGHACLRFDLEGLGDSPLDRDGRENHPYPDWATDNACEAFHYLRSQGHERFVALGLCSGAHTAFHAGLACTDETIERLILINPLTYRWVEGMSLETTRLAYDEMMYKQSMKDPKRWMKLLRGDVSFKRIFAVLARYPVKVAKRITDTVRETLLPALAPPLARQLRQLEAMGRPVTFFIAEGDPGYDLLKAGAPRTTARQLAEGTIRLVRIANADHTFSQAAPRRELIERLVEALGPAPAEPRREAPRAPALHKAVSAP